MAIPNEILEEERKNRREFCLMFSGEDLNAYWEEHGVVGVYQNLKETIESGVNTNNVTLQDHRIVWPEVYSFLLADIAMSLRKMAKRSGEEDPFKNKGERADAG